MPFVNRCGGASVDLQSKTVYPSNADITYTPDDGKDGFSSFTVKKVALQSKTVYPSKDDATYTPDDGKDGFGSFTVKGEKNIYGNCLSNYGVVSESGQTLTVSSVSSGYSGTDLTEGMHVLFIAAENVSLCTERDFVLLVIQFEKINNNIKAYTIADRKANDSEQTSRPDLKHTFSGEVTLDIDQDKIIIRIDDYSFNRTDGYGYEFSTTANYKCVSIYRDYFDA